MHTGSVKCVILQDIYVPPLLRLLLCPPSAVLAYHQRKWAAQTERCRPCSSVQSLLPTQPVVACDGYHAMNRSKPDTASVTGCSTCTDREGG